MADIVERLREHRTMSQFQHVSDLIARLNNERDDAADEIERLRAETQELKLQYLSDQGQWIEETGRLREALKQVGLYAWQGDTFKVMDIVRSAIMEKETD